jgi:hypothetical protein
MARLCFGVAATCDGMHRNASIGPTGTDLDNLARWDWRRSSGRSSGADSGHHSRFAGTSAACLASFFRKSRAMKITTRSRSVVGQSMVEMIILIAFCALLFGLSSQPFGDLMRAIVQRYWRFALALSWP